MPIGPTLPPHLAHLAGSTTPENEEDDNEAGPSIPRSTAPLRQNQADDDEADFGPALPPHLAAKRKTTTKKSGNDDNTRNREKMVYTSPSPPRIIKPSGPVGPSRPGASPPRTSRVGPARPPPPEEEDSDDEIGPTLPSDYGLTTQKTAVQEFQEREERRLKAIQEAQNPSKKLEREEWMLAPPTNSGVIGSIVDPLRKRPTTFNRNSKAPEEVSSVWTETPQEKAQRLADELAGVVRKKKDAKPVIDELGLTSEELERKRKRDREIKDEVERHNKSARGASLLEKHQKKGDIKEDGKGIWDHERDMGVTGRLLTDQERQKKIKDARGLNDRFGHSSRGAFSM